MRTHTTRAVDIVAGGAVLHGDLSHASAGALVA